MADQRWGFKLCALDQCEDCRAAIEEWLHISMTLDELDAIKRALIDNEGAKHGHGTRLRDNE